MTKGAWKAIFFWCVSSALAMLAWLYFRQAVDAITGRLSVVEVLSLGGIWALLSACLAVSLESIRVSRIWRYRLAFLISFSLIILFWLLAWGIPTDVGSAAGKVSRRPAGAAAGTALLCFSVTASLIAASLGAFLGGLFVTGLSERLWEDNSPPPEDIRAEVYQRHEQQIGQPGTMLWTKRGFDLLLSSGGLLLLTPVWLLSAFLIWFEDPGPLLFVKNSVGRGGINFHQFKFRTMLRGAEESTGPVLAQEEDPRVLRIGRLLRKTALDELPQLVNILKGEMSFVGPRPQRTVLVHNYLKSIPEYAERHRVLPGLAGLAQVAGSYYLTPRQKLRFDRLYIRYCSLGFDLKLLFLAFLITFWYRWQRGWNGRLPRRLLH